MSYAKEYSSKYDIFGRTRTSNLLTLFSDKQNIVSNDGILWDNATLLGQGTSVFDPVNCKYRMTIPANQTGRMVRQTFQRFNAQSGKPLLTFIAFKGYDPSLFVSPFGLEAYYVISLGDGDYGFSLFFRNEIPTLRFRTKTSGTIVDTIVPQTSWNINKMDGNGDVNTGKECRYKLDFAQEQLLVIEVAQFPQGYVRFGWMVNGEICYAHAFDTLNTSLFPSGNMNLPIRIIFERLLAKTYDLNLQIGSCAVFSEGGEENVGVVKSVVSSAVSYPTVGTIYPVMGIKLATPGACIQIENLALYLSSANDAVRWVFYRNPTITGTALSYSGTGYIQSALGTSASTITAGTGFVTQQGYLTSTQPIYVEPKNVIRLGYNIANVPDEFVVGIVPLTSGVTVEAVLTYRELA